MVYRFCWKSLKSILGPKIAYRAVKHEIEGWDLRRMVPKSLAKYYNKLQGYYGICNLSTANFLVNAESLPKAKASLDSKLVCLEIAAMRAYHDYALDPEGSLGVPSDIISTNEELIAKLLRNPLLTFSNGNVYITFERYIL